MSGGPGPYGPQRGLGKAVRQLREEAKLTQEVLAERAELSASQLARIEGGEEDPVWGDMRRIAAGLEISLERLAELAEAFEKGDVL